MRILERYVVNSSLVHSLMTGKLSHGHRDLTEKRVLDIHVHTQFLLPFPPCVCSFNISIPIPIPIQSIIPFLNSSYHIHITLTFSPSIYPRSFHERTLVERGIDCGREGVPRPGWGDGGRGRGGGWGPGRGRGRGMESILFHLATKKNIFKIQIQSPTRTH